jgi:ATP-dependent phosphofructokinase / diphosphate-dependent phosphofructokinase
MDLLADGVTGRMMAVREGRYGVAPLPGPDERPRRVDVAIQYNADRLRPRYDGLLGRPLLLGMPLA